MKENGDIYTATMAKVYASQGHWDKAIEIYQYLLKEEPGRDDFAQALADLEKKKAGADGTAGKKFEDLAPLCREWIDLMLKHNRMQKLKKLKKRL